MKKRIEIAKLISSDVRSRANAEKIVRSIDSGISEIELDFKDVTFMSRSFADELCDIIERMNWIHFTESNMSAFVEAMFNTVSNGRNREREREVYDADIIYLNDMKSLTEFFTHASI